MSERRDGATDTEPAGRWGSGTGTRCRTCGRRHRSTGDYDDPELGGSERRPAWLVGGAVVLALVVGLAGGYLLGGGTSRDSAVASVETSAEPVPPTTAAPPDPATPQPCLAAGDAARRVLQEVDAAVAAAGALDAGALRQVLDRLQPAQTDLERALAGCAPLTGPGG